MRRILASVVLGALLVGFTLPASASPIAAFERAAQPRLFVLVGEALAWFQRSFMKPGSVQDPDGLPKVPNSPQTSQVPDPPQSEPGSIQDPDGVT
jgi:hypothetical protein